MDLAARVANDFPFLTTNIAYLDNAATTQKPRCVIAAEKEYYERYCANVHRGLYAWSEEATTKFEDVRTKVQQFIGAEYPEEILFTSGTTMSLNLAARFVSQHLSQGDEIILTNIEHHANILPWQFVAKEKGLQLRFLLNNADHTLDPAQLAHLITKRSRVLAITHVSNATGLIVPLQKFVQQAHAHGMIVVVDGAQSVPHLPLNVVDLGADFFAFSAHKMYGPTGIGALYGKKELLEKAFPVIGGGSMIDEVTLESATFAPLPAKFEPGTPNIAGVIGWGAALDYIRGLGMDNIHKTEQQLTTYARNAFADLPQVTLYAPKNPAMHTGIFSFTVDGVHPHDVAAMLDHDGVAVRAGHHCAQPLMRALGISSTTRASLSFYNTTNDIDRLIKGLHKAHALFA